MRGIARGVPLESSAAEGLPGHARIVVQEHQATTTLARVHRVPLEDFRLLVQPPHARCAQRGRSRDRLDRPHASRAQIALQGNTRCPAARPPQGLAPSVPSAQQGSTGSAATEPQQGHAAHVPCAQQGSF